jgi:hypothetical protein
MDSGAVNCWHIEHDHPDCHGADQSQRGPGDAQRGAAHENRMHGAELTVNGRSVGCRTRPRGDAEFGESPSQAPASALDRAPHLASARHHVFVPVVAMAFR